jgi:OOP family OmpA-OmpF porin
MIRTPLLLILLLIYHIGYSQDTIATAKVIVTVTDTKGHPRKGDIVLFKGQSTYQGQSGIGGKFTISLPIGQIYSIIVKNLGDSSRTGSLNIPALQPDQEYTDPFTVNIKYEPARTYTLDNVHFDFSKATLRPESFTELQELIDYLQSKQDVRIEIAGHTDNVGQKTDNLKLSQERANTIKGYLVKKGISASRIVAKGYGDSVPIADNSTDEGRQKNRRTEVKILP